MTPHRAFRFCDLWLFSILWTLLLVTVAVWLGDPPTPPKAREKPVKLIRYVGETNIAPPDLMAKNRR